jgi:hypothetical protein
MYARLVVVMALAAGACHPQPRAAPVTTGAIIGLVRDSATGEPIAMAALNLRADGELGRKSQTKSSHQGLYDFANLRPGRYALTAYFAGDVVEVANITVVAGRIAPVDVAFELGRVEPLVVDYGNPQDGAIARYTPKRANPNTGLIEGTVSDSATRERVAGAVVTALYGDRTDSTLQTVTDDRGRFVFEDLPPGVYAVSAYYTIATRGQIEVLRNSLDVHGGEAVIVPLWVELESQ